MPEERTIPQNSAMHLFHKQLADELNEAGLEMKKVLKPEYDIWWTAENVKEHLWKPIMKSLFVIDSTTELKTNQVNDVHQVLMKNLCEKFGIEYIPFPSWESNK